MHRRTTIVFLIAALAAGCGDDAANTPATVTMLSGRYTARNPVTMVTEMAAALETVAEPAEEHEFEEAAEALAAGRPVPTFLSQIDAEFSGDAAGAGPFTTQGAIRDAMARWRMTPTDASVQTATGETIEKTIDMSRLLAMHSEVRAALTAVAGNDWTAARSRWDRAAAWFSTLENAYAHRADTAATNIWGATATAITDENLATRTTDLLTRGAQLIDARATENLRDTAQQLLVYSTKYPYLSAVNYASVFESRAQSMGDIEYPRAEGGAFFNAFVTAFHGRASAGSPAETLARTGRARWAYGVNASTGPSRLAVIRDAGALYASLTAPGVEGYATASDVDRAATRSTLRGVVDTLDEALTFARQDPSAMRAKISTAETRSLAGDHAGAAALLREVQQSLDAVTRAGM